MLHLKPTAFKVMSDQSMSKSCGNYVQWGDRGTSFEAYFWRTPPHGSWKVCNSPRLTYRGARDWWRMRNRSWGTCPSLSSQYHSGVYELRKIHDSWFQSVLHLGARDDITQQNVGGHRGEGHAAPFAPPPSRFPPAPGCGPPPGPPFRSGRGGASERRRWWWCRQNTPKGGDRTRNYWGEGVVWISSVL